jgi:ABC-2 type transport system permease protein
MAEVMRSGIREQVWLVMDLRWKIFRNGLRGVSAKLSLAGSILAGFVWGCVAFGLGIGVAVGTYFLLQREQFDALGYIFWGLFIFWQVVPILTSQFAAGFDSTGLLRFPLRFSSFFALHLAYGLADPVSLTGIFWHFCMFAGLVLVRPNLWAQFALIVALSALMNLLFSRMLFTWLERLLAQRRTREILFVVMMLAFLCLQFSGLIVRRWAEPLTRFFEQTTVLWKALPPGQAGVALTAFSTDGARLGLGACGVLSLFTLAFGTLLGYRLHGQFRGEYFGETAAPAARARKIFPATASPAAVLSTSPDEALRAEPFAGIISGPVAAVFMKEIRYLSRNSMQLLSLVLPLLLVAFFGFTWHTSGPRGNPFGGFHGASSFAYPTGVAYTMLLVVQLFMNCFAYDSSGVQMFFLAPVKFRDVMLGKNLYQGAVLAAEAMLAWIVIAVSVAPPPLSILLTTWTGLIVIALLSMAAGNLFSLKLPRRLEFGVRRQRMAGFTMLAYLSFHLIYFATLGVLGAVAALVRWLAGPWTVPVAFLALGVAALSLYRTLLEETSQLAIKQRETLIQQLVR